VRYGTDLSYINTPLRSNLRMFLGVLQRSAGAAKLAMLDF
jgi:hypothetical protein